MVLGPQGGQATTTNKIKQVRVQAYIVLGEVLYTSSETSSIYTLLEYIQHWKVPVYKTYILACLEMYFIQTQSNATSQIATNVRDV